MELTDSGPQLKGISLFIGLSFGYRLMFVLSIDTPDVCWEQAAARDSVQSIWHTCGATLPARVLIPLTERSYICEQSRGFASASRLANSTADVPFSFTLKATRLALSNMSVVHPASAQPSGR